MPLVCEHYVRTQACCMCRPRIRTALKQDKQRRAFRHLEALQQDDVRYIGRPPSATTATAAYSIHLLEQEQLIDVALAP
jgi:2-oxoglutarate dehydrogenase complex dehydrogenase (E1) component-like enzyme